MNKENEILEKMRVRIKNNEELSIEMARMGIQTVFNEKPGIKSEIDKIVAMRQGDKYES